MRGEEEKPSGGPSWRWQREDHRGTEERDGVGAKGCRTTRGVRRVMMGQKERAEPLLKVCVPHIPALSPTLPGTVLGVQAFGRGFGYKGGALGNGCSDL